MPHNAILNGFIINEAGQQFASSRFKSFAKRALRACQSGFFAKTYAKIIIASDNLLITQHVYMVLAIIDYVSLRKHQLSGCIFRIVYFLQ